MILVLRKRVDFEFVSLTTDEHRQYGKEHESGVTSGKTTIKTELRMVIGANIFAFRVASISNCLYGMQSFIPQNLLTVQGGQ
jgi:hypothetical protein